LTIEELICMCRPDFAAVLKAGVTRFQQQVFPKRRLLFEKLAKGQNPKALFLTCADSRVIPSLITHTGPGQLFIERNPGNLVPVYREEAVGVSASIEYAVTALRVEHIIICGHSDCGIIKGLLRPDAVTQLPAVARWMEFGKAARDALFAEFCHLPEAEQLPILTEFNVLNQIDNLSTHPSVQQALQEERLTIHGWVYQIESGEVREYNMERSRFESWPEVQS